MVRLIGIVAGALLVAPGCPTEPRRAGRVDASVAGSRPASAPRPAPDRVGAPCCPSVEEEPDACWLAQLDAAAADVGHGIDDDDPAEPDGDSPLARVRRAAEELLAPDRAPRWGREGRLEPEDLTNGYVTVGDGGLEAFTVLDADGYQGAFKCNLLVFELAYRAGLLVPLISRVRGWAYPGPRIVARLVEGDSVIGGWARVVDGASLAEARAALDAGRVLVLVGVGPDGGAGHMAIVEELRALERRAAGAIASAAHVGWEASGERAERGLHRWGPGRFETIHLLELVAPRPGQSQVVVIGPPPDEPSLADAARVSPEARAIASSNARRGDGPERRLWEDGPPSLPVVHSVLDQGSVFGRVVDVEGVVRSVEDDAAGSGQPGELPPIDAMVERARGRSTPGAQRSVDAVLRRAAPRP